MVYSFVFLLNVNKSIYYYPLNSIHGLSNYNYQINISFVTASYGERLQLKPMNQHQIYLLVTNISLMLIRHQQIVAIEILNLPLS